MNFIRLKKLLIACTVLIVYTIDCNLIYELKVLT